MPTDPPHPAAVSIAEDDLSDFVFTIPFAEAIWLTWATIVAGRRTGLALGHDSGGSVGRNGAIVGIVYDSFPGCPTGALIHWWGCLNRDLSRIELLTLLDSFEREIAARGVVKAFIYQQSGDPALVVKQRILEERGWSGLTPLNHRYHGDVDRFFRDVPWAKTRLETPVGATWFEWDELDEAERESIVKEDGPESIAAANLPADVQTANLRRGYCPGLRIGGEVIGWIAVMNIPVVDAIYYPGVFVRPKYRRSHAARAIIREALARQHRDSGAPRVFVWDSQPENLPLTKFYRRHFRGAMISETMFYWSEKNFGAGPTVSPE